MDFDKTEHEWSDAERRVHRARTLYEQGRWAEAAAELQAAIAVHPDQAAWHFNLAVTLEAMGDYQAATESFTAALQLDPTDVECLNCLAGTLTQLGRCEEALEYYATIDEIDPNFEASYCNRIATYSEMGHHEQAEMTFYLARQLTDSCPVCSYNIANSLYLRGLFEHAIANWKETLRVQPDHSHAHARIGETYWRVGQLDRAKWHFRSQLANDPTDLDTMLDYGDLLREMGDDTLARQQYRRAARQQPGHVGAYIALGEMALKRHDATEAGRWFRTALKIEPKNPTAHLRLAQVLVAERDIQAGAKHLTVGLKYADNDPKLLQECSRLLMEANLYRRANGVLGQLATIWPDNANVHHNLAVTCFRLKRYDEGVKHCRRALRIEPKYPLALYNLAIAHQKLGQRDRARCCVAKGLRVEPEHRALKNLARDLGMTPTLWRRVRRAVGRQLARLTRR